MRRPASLLQGLHGPASSRPPVSDVSPVRSDRLLLPRPCCCCSSKQQQLRAHPATKSGQSSRPCPKTAGGSSLLPPTRLSEPNCLLHTTLLPAQTTLPFCRSSPGCSVHAPTPLLPRPRAHHLLLLPPLPPPQLPSVIQLAQSSCLQGQGLGYGICAGDQHPLRLGVRMARSPVPNMPPSAQQCAPAQGLRQSTRPAPGPCARARGGSGVGQPQARALRGQHLAHALQRGAVRGVGGRVGWGVRLADLHLVLREGKE